MKIDETFIKLLTSKEFTYLGPYQSNKEWEYFQINQYKDCEFWYRAANNYSEFDSVAIKPVNSLKTSSFSLHENKLCVTHFRFYDYKASVPTAISCLEIFQQETGVDCFQILLELNDISKVRR